MKTSSILIIISLLLVLQSCDTTVQTTHDNGVVHEVYQTNDDGQKHGSYERHDLKGNLIEVANYKMGKLDGLRTLYYPDGKIEIEENYAQDLLEGEYRSYYESGIIQLETIYEGNVMNDTLRTYYLDGTPKEVVLMKDNDENGPFVEYHPNGQKHWEGTYRNGDNEVGLLSEYDTEGQLIKKMQCSDKSICQTIWTLADGDITPQNIDQLIQ